MPDPQVMDVGVAGGETADTFDGQLDALMTQINFEVNEPGSGQPVRVNGELLDPSKVDMPGFQLSSAKLFNDITTIISFIGSVIDKANAIFRSSVIK